MKYFVIYHHDKEDAHCIAEFSTLDDATQFLNEQYSHGFDYTVIKGEKIEFERIQPPVTHKPKGAK